MSDQTNNNFAQRAEPLANFELELRNHIDDDALLHEIHVALKSMLSGDGVSESEVRAMLQSQFSQGELREESYLLVQNLIDRIVSADTETAPNTSSNNEEEDADDDPFRETFVIASATSENRTADQNLQVGSVLRDRFMLTEEVSGGSMGTIYKALDRRLAEVDSENHWVAIKVLTPKLSRNADALRALQQEAVKTRCLSHPNIVSFIDLDRDEDMYFMVMEWLEGRSLSDILDDNDNESADLEMATIMAILRQVAAALQYAHQRGIIHADVKPGNIMITSSGQAKLFDFGVARIRQKQGATQRKFDPGVLNAVTPAYSSMQVITGEEPVAADDVFSLACLAYRLIAGYRAFGPRNAAEAAEAGMEPQRIESVNKTQWQALRKALAFSRVARFASPAEFMVALTGESNPGVVASVAASAPVIPATDIRVDDIEPGTSKMWRFVVLMLIFASAAAIVYQNELMAWLQTASDTPGQENVQNIDLPSPSTIEKDPSSTASGSTVSRVPEVGAIEPDSVEVGPVEYHAGAADGSTGESPLADMTAVDSDDGLSGDSNTGAAVEAFAEPLVDFSRLRPANMLITLADSGEIPDLYNLILREDSDPAIVDFERTTRLDESLTLRVAETRYDGNDSPLNSGQYGFSNDGVIRFPPGQNRARVTIAMESDPLRESDRQVTLTVLDSDFDDIEFASIHLTLQDDDQRIFEESLPINTVAFAVNQVSVRERDPAVQIDLVRFKPDGTSLEAEYEIRDVTAKEGEDYIAPGLRFVSFEPNQRSARILIPLIQDSKKESDEAFMLELVAVGPATEGNTYRRIAVMIRDDDP